MHANKAIIHFGFYSCMHRLLLYNIDDGVIQWKS